MLKSQKIIYLMLVTVLFSIASPIVTFATSVDSIKQEEAKVKQEGEALSREIDSVIEVINQKYKELADLDQKIEDSQTDIQNTEAEIVKTQDTISKRTEVVGKRLKEMQIREASNSNLEALLGAETFADFINRAYAFSVLQNAEKSKLEALYDEEAKLAKLEEKLVTTQNSLKEQQATAEEEKNSLDKDVAGLQTKLKDNAATLSSLTAQRVEKENAIREAAAIEAARVAQAEKDRLAAKQNNATNPTNVSTKPGANTNTNANNNGGGQIAQPVPPVTPVPPTPPAPPTSGLLTGQATAYIATGNRTATGTVPTPGRTIAVDPSVIPLGSAVQIIVPGAPRYSGIYIAEDTGGVVKGHIIDVFVSGQTEALNFGRQSISFKVL